MATDETWWADAPPSMSGFDHRNQRQPVGSAPKARENPTSFNEGLAFHKAQKHGKRGRKGRRSEAGDRADGGLGIWRRLPVRAGRKEWRRGEEGVWVMGWTRMWKARGNGMGQTGGEEPSQKKGKRQAMKARGVIIRLVRLGACVGVVGTGTDMDDSVATHF